MENGLDACLTSPEAHQARASMKRCQKPCLQTCWAHPESDDLQKIVEDFLSKIGERKDKEQLLKSAKELLEQYEVKVAASHDNA